MNSYVCVFVNKVTGDKHIGAKIMKTNILGVSSHLLSLIVSPDNPKVMNIVDFSRYSQLEYTSPYDDMDLPGYENASFFVSTYNKIHGL